MNKNNLIISVGRQLAEATMLRNCLHSGSDAHSMTARS